MLTRYFLIFFSIFFLSHFFVEANENAVSEICTIPLGGGVVCSIDGSTSAYTNETITYNAVNFTEGSPSSTYNWWASGGTIISHTMTSVTIEWTTTGTFEIHVFYGVTITPSAIKTVTIANGCPSTPTAPTASTNTCGNKTLTRANPPSDVTYYWQTSSSGTSTSNSSSTYSVSSSGTYYLRARHNTTGCWSSASSKSVTVYPIPTNPRAPSISSNTCGAKTLSRVTPPSGVTWYWQGTTENGSSTSNSSSTYSVSSSGTYYIQAKNSAASCWSLPGTVVSVTVIDYPSNPPTPSASTNTCGNKTLTRGTPPGGVTYYWQGTNSSGTSTSNSSSTYSASSSGTYYLRARNSSGC